MSFIPTIGLRGVYTLKSPFDSLVTANTIYTCQSIRTIADYLAANEDVLSLLYTDNGLTQADYDTDLNNNTLIVALQSDSGSWVLVPTSYILSPPVIDGVTYYNYMLGVGKLKLENNNLLSISITTSIRSYVR